MKAKDFDVLIVGAGVMGSSLAMHLAQRGGGRIGVVDLDLEGTVSSSELNAGGVRATWNQPIKHLCAKHGLSMSSMYGETEVKVELPPRTFQSLVKESTTKQSQLWRLILGNVNPYFKDL